MLVRCNFHFLCQKDWSDLIQTNDPGIRFCSSCKQKVFLCSEESDLEKHTAAGDCVAIPGVRRMMLGLPSSARESFDKWTKHVKKNKLG